MAIFPSILLACLTAVVVNAYPTISSPEYQLILRYTKYAAASYADKCPTPPNGAVVVKYFNESTTDTQATLFRNDAQQEIIIAFRGTSDTQDFSTDTASTLVPITAVGTANCKNCTVHNGTQLAWNSVSASVISAVRQQESQYPAYQFKVTGHSLGGALASIATASLYGVGLKPTTYSFGQFRTGNPSYANYIDSILPPTQFHRVTHTNDGVPQTFTAAMGYRHHATEFWELEPFGPNNTQQCNGQDVPDCNNSEPGVGIGDGGIGINAAHLCYTGIPIGNPVDGGANACGAPSAIPPTCS